VDFQKDHGMPIIPLCNCGHPEPYHGKYGCTTGDGHSVCNCREYAEHN